MIHLCACELLPSVSSLSLQSSQLAHCQPSPPDWFYWPATVKQKCSKWAFKYKSSTRSDECGAICGWWSIEQRLHQAAAPQSAFHAAHKKKLIIIIQPWPDCSGHTLFWGRTNCTENLQPRTQTRVRTFSDVLSVSMSCFFCVKMMLKTAWERLLVSFMLVAATVLKRRSELAIAVVVVVVVFSSNYIYRYNRVAAHRALFPESIRSWMSLYEVTASLERSST